MGDEKLRLQIPRIYDTKTKKAVPLEHYRELRDLPAVNDQILTAVLLGLSTGDSHRVAQELTDSFGLSRSSVSTRFIEASAQRLQAFQAQQLLTKIAFYTRMSERLVQEYYQLYKEYYPQTRKEELEE